MRLRLGTWRQAALLTVVLATLVLVWPAGQRSVTPVAAPPPPVVDAPTAPEASSGAANERVASRRRLVERIAVSPRKICRGTPVTVTAHLRADAADSAVTIGGHPGAARVVEFTRAGRETLSILARDWHDGIDVRRVRVHVRDCDTAALRVVATPIDADHIGFRLVDPPAATAFRWDLGDGTTRTTTLPQLAHDYSQRSADRPTTTFVITVDTAAADGSTLSGRLAVHLPNPRWVANRGRNLWLATRAERFVPTAAADGTRTATLHVRGDGAAVRLTGASLIGFPCRDLDDELPAAVDATALSRDTITAADETTVTVRLPATAWTEPVCSVDVRLLGITDAGRPARAFANVELGRPATVSVVRDPALRARLRAARTLLGRGQITAEELAMLAAEGKL